MFAAVKVYSSVSITINALTISSNTPFPKHLVKILKSRCLQRQIVSYKIQVMSQTVVISTAMLFLYQRVVIEKK